MTDYLSADDAASLVGRSGKTVRAVLRKLRDDGNLDPYGAWQDPPTPHGVWTIRRQYLEDLAHERGWQLM